MSGNNHNDRQTVKIESITLDDGRKAERHTYFDESGNEIVEIFAEEKRPLKLEKRIEREYKNVVANERHSTIQDGEIVYEEALSGEPEVPLQVRQKIGVADHSKVVDGDYVRKDEIGELVANGVVTGVKAMMENMDYDDSPKHSPDPVFGAQSEVEENVQKKQNWNTIVNVGLGVLFVGQIVVAYVFLF